MAYVVRRPNRRFEVRESIHTPKGPRARTLAGFMVLTDDVLAAASQRATRLFDREAVIDSGRRAGALMKAGTGAGRDGDSSSEGFVEASRRMALSMRRLRPSKPMDPGAALIELLGFADAVTRSQPARAFEPLTFPVLSRFAEDRGASAGMD